VKIRHQVIVFDAADVDAEAAFWAGALDGDIDVDSGWRMVIVDGEPHVGASMLPITCHPTGRLARRGNRSTSICGSTTSARHMIG
jgi:hypothetical protein